MNDAGKRHDYPARVRFEIAENELASYQRAADFLNVNERRRRSACSTSTASSAARRAATCSPCLRELRMPIVTTLHTILAEPNPQQRAVMDELTAALRAGRRHERARRDAAGSGPRRPRRRRSISSPTASPTCRRAGPQQGPARRRGQVGHPDVRAALAGQGHRVRHRRAAGHPRAPPRDRLHRARRDASARQGAATARPTA